jgi:hypothetical protein
MVHRAKQTPVHLENVSIQASNTSAVNSPVKGHLAGRGICAGLFTVFIACSTSCAKSNTVQLGNDNSNTSSAINGKTAHSNVSTPGTTNISADVQSRPSGHNTVGSIGKEMMLEQLAPRLSRSTRDLTVTRGPHGEVLVDLQGRFSHVTLAKRTSDGRIKSTCVNTIEAANAWLSSESASRDKQ